MIKKWDDLSDGQKIGCVSGGTLLALLLLMGLIIHPYFAEYIEAKRQYRHTFLQAQQDNQQYQQSQAQSTHCQKMQPKISGQIATPIQRQQHFLAWVQAMANTMPIISYSAKRDKKQAKATAPCVDLQLKAPFLVLMAFYQHVAEKNIFAELVSLNITRTQEANAYCIMQARFCFADG